MSLTADAPAPEPWLRGTLTELAAEQRAVLHALQLAGEDIRRWCGRLSDEELHEHPHGLPSAAFQVRHILGSLDRLMTYAEGNPLNPLQRTALSAEANAEGSRAQILAEFEQGIALAEQRIRAIDIGRWPEPRKVGRKELPTTVGGLLIHCAEHTQRHVGQAVTTVKVLLALRNKSS
ncbi:MAG TPA: DinB family protein [Acidobacteriaceae bacterium]|nr:DinB family protein [Acidobacteriaceae bacterium]